MKIFQINAVPYGSTGRIMFELADTLKMQGHHTLCTAGFTWKTCERDDFFLTSNIVEKTVHTYLARLTGRIGCFSVLATKRLLKKMDEFKPDIIHLHNLHCWFVNLPMLFDYIRAHDIPVVWTLHDCWSFTGHCPHFDGIGCQKWKTGCQNCPLYRDYPQTYFDFSKTMYEKKRRWFSGVMDLTLVTPSQWLADLTRQSFLQEYPVKVLHNGIDLKVFSPQKSEVRSKYGITKKYMVLGVAYAWDHKKGLDVFESLAQKLGNDYQIVLVGCSKELKERLDPKILGIERTQNQTELAELYSAADVFVNPTREDTFPTVNIESLACGTPVLTFNTGGSPEIPDDSCGIVVSRGDCKTLKKQLEYICEEHPFTQEQCVKRAENFSKERYLEQYLDLYRRIYERSAES